MSKTNAKNCGSENQTPNQPPKRRTLCICGETCHCGDDCGCGAS